MTDKKSPSKLRLMLELFISFFKIGAFTFGGGYAMIPLIQHEMVEKKGWISDDDILEIIAIAESTPGPIAINMATFVGTRTCGFFGAFCATFGVVLPSFIVISVVARLLREFSDIKAVQYAFNGIRAGVLALLLKALYTMYKKVKKDVFGYVVMLAAFLVASFTDISVLIVIICCAICGIVSSLIISRKEHKL
ncbi:MAG: chromate transporter [Ruminococcaceae bacterium]|nr:chromate transporter [Oscillospiraceae bacterium]